MYACQPSWFWLLNERMVASSKERDSDWSYNCWCNVSNKYIKFAVTFKGCCDDTGASYVSAGREKGSRWCITPRAHHLLHHHPDRGRDSPIRSQIPNLIQWWRTAVFYQFRSLESRHRIALSRQRQRPQRTSQPYLEQLTECSWKPWTTQYWPRFYSRR